MNNNLDHLFKKALQDKSCEPPPYIWGNIERQLNKSKHKVALWWWRTAAAAAVVAAFIGIWLFYSVESPEIEVAGITGTEILKTKDSTNLPDTFSDSIQEEKTVQYVTKETVTEVPVLIAQNKRTELEPIQMHRAGEAGFIEQTAPDYAISTRKLQRNFIPLTSKEAYQNQKEYQKLLNTPTSLTTDEKRKIKVMVSGHFVPAYSSGSYSSSLKNSRGVSYSSNQMDGLMNVGGGLKLSVSANKRFSVQTGLFYSRMGQKTSGAGSGVRAMMLPSLQHSDRMIATPLGNIKTHTQVPPVFEQPGQIGEEEEILPNVEEYTITENKDVSDGPVIQEIVADYYRDPKVMIDDRDELPAEENEEEEHVQFDIRQAIISSEILKRPQY